VAVPSTGPDLQVLLIDAICVKIRDGAVADRPVYVALGVNCRGERDVLGLGADTGEVKFWMTVFSELKSRRVTDACIVCCDGLKGLPDTISDVWPKATVQLSSCTWSGPACGMPPRITGARSARARGPIYTAYTAPAKDTAGSGRSLSRPAW
jgi:putative transposase